MKNKLWWAEVGLDVNKYDLKDFFSSWRSGLKRMESVEKCPIPRYAALYSQDMVHVGQN